MLRLSACTEFIEVKQDECKPSVMLRLSACTEFIEVKQGERKPPCHAEALEAGLTRSLIEFTLPPTTIGEDDSSFHDKRKPLSC